MIGGLRRTVEKSDAVMQSLLARITGKAVLREIGQVLPDAENRNRPDLFIHEERGVDLRPLRPVVDETEFAAPIPVTMESLNLLLSSPAYVDKIRPYFIDYPKLSLMWHECRAFIYALVRMSKPEAVAEIGTYFAGTAEVFARALWENGRGVLYTTDPYGAERAPAVICQWPAPLQEMVRFSADDSMMFLGQLARSKTLLDVILIDGNHEYEFASFDLALAAKTMRPGGVIIMDNAEQTGPFEAARHFLAENPDWRELGTAISRFNPSDPFVMPRCSIPDTSFIVLQAPFCFTIGARLRSWGDEAVPSHAQSPGFALEFSPQECRGRLHFQAVYRGFAGNGRGVEELKQHGNMAIELNGAAGAIEHYFDKPSLSEVFVRFFPDCHHTFELELFWEAASGSGPLTLSARPRPVWSSRSDTDGPAGEAQRA
jgi:predicted O-methyltransferase YrrM